MGEREAADLKRAQNILGSGTAAGLADAARIEAEFVEYMGAESLTDALFGPYRCKLCSSYLHDETDHGSGLLRGRGR